MEIRSYQKGDTQEIFALLKEEGWNSFVDTFQKEYQKALDISLTYIAIEENIIVGYIRAISDGVFLTFIAEMVIAKTHRKKHIGTKLLSYLMDHHPTCKFELISDIDVFYQKNEFLKVGTGMRNLRK